LPNMQALWLWRETQSIAWQTQQKTISNSVNTTWNQTMDMTNSIAGTSINLPV
jgi:hypothetical protein